jgi:NAD(P)-dependent dehydrogenase (short-subunit alcohol dehydrogenase family)
VTGGADLSGQVALVTGGGRGIGRQITLELGARGVAVALVARSIDQLDEVAAQVEEAGGRALVTPGDVTDRLAVEGIVARVEGELGPIDLLVNNAGAGVPSEFLKTDPDDWWRTIEVNLRGPALFCHYVLRRMVIRRRGRIVNVASGAAVRPTPLGSEYACSKAAVLRLTDCLAEMAWEHQISVFAVSPGLVRTDLTRSGFEEAPLSDWAPIEKIGHLVADLATGRADRLSGRFIHVHDDLGELIAHASEIEREDLHQLRMRTYVSRPWEPPRSGPAAGQARPEEVPEHPKEEDRPEDATELEPDGRSDEKRDAAEVEARESEKPDQGGEEAAELPGRSKKAPPKR